MVSEHWAEPRWKDQLRRLADRPDKRASWAAGWIGFAAGSGTTALLGIWGAAAAAMALGAAAGTWIAAGYLWDYWTRQARL